MVELPSGEWPIEQKNAASKFNTLHVDLLYKSQPFKDCFNNKNNQYMSFNILLLNMFVLITKTSHVWVTVTTLLCNLSMTDAVVGIGVQRGGKGLLFFRV